MAEKLLFYTGNSLILVALCLMLFATHPIMFIVVMIGVVIMLIMLMTWKIIKHHKTAQQSCLSVHHKQERESPIYPAPRPIRQHIPYPPIDIRDTDTMTGVQFEAFCKTVLERNGYTEIRETPKTGDNGVDLICRYGQFRIAVQCKCYASNVGRRAVQEVFTGKTVYKCNQAIVITNSYFTDSAKKTAMQTGVLLYDREKLKMLIKRGDSYYKKLDKSSIL